MQNRNYNFVILLIRTSKCFAAEVFHACHQKVFSFGCTVGELTRERFMGANSPEVRLPVSECTKTRANG